MSDSHEIQILSHQTTICQWSQSGRILIIHSPEVNSSNAFYPHCLSASHGSHLPTLPTPMASGLRDFWIEALEHTRLTHRKMAGSGCSSHRWLGNIERSTYRHVLSVSFPGFVPYGGYTTIPLFPWRPLHIGEIHIFGWHNLHCCQSKPLFPVKKTIYSLLDWWPIRSPQVQGIQGIQGTISAAAKSEYFSAQWDAAQAGASRLGCEGNRPTRGPATFWFPTVARIRQNKHMRNPSCIQPKVQWQFSIFHNLQTWAGQPSQFVHHCRGLASLLSDLMLHDENHHQGSGPLWS